MKLIINYDLTNKLKDINEPYGIRKIVRNNKPEILFYILSSLPFDLLIAHESLKTAEVMALFQVLTYFTIEFSDYIDSGDHYKKIAIKDLRNLVSLLRDNYIKTDLELLKKSEVYEKNYQLHLNQEKIIEVLESKYILIPTYDFNGYIKNTSILQEHILGSNDYILSLGSPSKKFKLVYARNFNWQIMEKKVDYYGCLSRRELWFIILNIKCL